MVQMSARTPAATAMSAATLDDLSGGRFMLGLGVSGPQVVEGWYGQPFPKPLARTREYVEIVATGAGAARSSTSDGQHYPLPLPGGTGLGKPLKLDRCIRCATDIPILLGAEGPKNVALATEIADGWLPIFYHVERGEELYEESLAGAPGGLRGRCPVTVVVNDDVAAAIEYVKWTLAFYIGGMGAESHNFHLDVIGRFGFAEEAATGPAALPGRRPGGGDARGARRAGRRHLAVRPARADQGAA